MAGFVENCFSNLKVQQLKTYVFLHQDIFQCIISVKWLTQGWTFSEMASSVRGTLSMALSKPRTGQKTMDNRIFKMSKKLEERRNYINKSVN